MTDYMRVIIYLRNHEAADNTVGYARIEKRAEHWSLSLSLTECMMPVNSSIFLFYREGNTIQNHLLGEMTDGVTWEWQGNMDLPASIVGMIVGEKTMYLTGAVPGEQLPTYEMLMKEIPVATQELEKMSATQEEIELSEAERLREIGEEMYPFEDDEMTWCRQMEPEDLSSFPVGKWSLMGNTFLMQGYYQYRHLLCASDGEKMFIGVPGQYHRRELYLAKKFGFSAFKSTRKKRVVLGDFGYWLREL